MANIQQEVKALSKKMCGVSHSTHMITGKGGSSQAWAWGSKLQRWEPSGPQGESWSLDALSLQDHELSTEDLLERDWPSRYHPDGNDEVEVMEVDVDGLEEEGSHGGHSGEHTQDSSPNLEGSDASSDHSSDHRPNPRSNARSNPGSKAGSSSSSSSSEDEGKKLASSSLQAGFFTDMFATLANTLKKLEGREQSSSRSWSLDADRSKCHHGLSPESLDPGKLDKKKKHSEPVSKE